MAAEKVWLVTGAGRGMGVDIAKAALEAGYKVVATGRNPTAVERTVGKATNLHVVKLDVTQVSDAENAVRSTVDRFGRLDVLVNNAGNFFAGFFEELTPDEVRKQIDTLLFGPMNVTRAALPVMRKQRSGHIINISSLGGLVGGAFTSAYAAAKFGIEGWTESLQPEIEPFGIHTTLVNPGFFRTELITNKSMTFGSRQIPDYEERRKQQQAFWTGHSGKQPGDPAKLARGLIQIARLSPPPRRWVAGADAMKGAEQKAKTLLAETTAFADLSSSLDHAAVQAKTRIA
jgi:NAD(P)-dependent dehydrogenase (short-subunit alcohol dehydrogenase family)